jgi:integrase
MTVRKRGDVWYYDFMLGGVRYRKALPEAEGKPEALDIEARDRRLARQGKLGRQDETNFERFVREVYLPWSREHKRSYRADVWRAEVLIEHFGQLTLPEIVPFRVEQFKRERREGETRYRRRRTPASVNRELELLSRVLSMAVDHGAVETNVCSRVKKYREDNKRTRVLTREEEGRLMAVLGRPGRALLRALVVIALNTGMRRGEITSLVWADVDLERSLVQVRQTKTGRGRIVPINAAAREVFESLPRRERDEGVRLFEIDWIEKGWRGACQQAGITGLRFHDLRHTFATRLLDAGTDAFNVAALLGHSRVEMTARYAHATSERMREAVASLGKFVSNLSQASEVGKTKEGAK